MENKEVLLKRFNVHTFAYADRNFNNPEGLLGCLEHYVNKYDPVVLFGIIGFQKQGNIMEMYSLIKMVKDINSTSTTV